VCVLTYKYDDSNGSSKSPDQAIVRRQPTAKYTTEVSVSVFFLPSRVLLSPKGFNP